MFAAAMMAEGASATLICFSVKLVGPRSTVPQTNWIRNVRDGSETMSVGGFRLRKSRRRKVGPESPWRPAGDDQGDPPPVARHLIAIGFTFPATRLRIGRIAELIHERARGCAYSLDLFQLPKQPRKHVRPLVSTLERGFGCVS